MKDVLNLYRPNDFIFKGVSKIENEFFADIEGRFVSPKGKTYVVPGFYNGDNQWIIRFAPTETGKWKFTVNTRHISVTEGDTEGSFDCTKGEGTPIHGPVLIDVNKSDKFVYENGEAYMMNAYESNWLWAMDIEKIEEFMRQIKSYGFNMVITNLYAHDTSWCSGNTSPFDFGPPALYAWEGTNEAPDHSRLNTQFFKKYDMFVDLLFKMDINIHLYFKVYNKLVNWMKPYSAEDELYIKYVTARYQSYSNILWDYSKESLFEPDKAYIAWYIKKIRSFDTYGRLVSLHDDCVFQDNAEYNKLVDYITIQHHEHFSDFCDFYYFGLYHKQRYNMPLFFAEFGYECGPSGDADLTYPVGHSPERLLDMALEVVFAQCYTTYYYTRTAWDVIDYSIIPPGYQYFKNLNDITKELSIMDWNVIMPFGCFGCKMLERNNKSEYLILTERNHHNSVIMPQLENESCKYTAEWIGIQDNKRIPCDYKELPCVNTSACSIMRQVKSPFEGQPALLHIKILSE